MISREFQARHSELASTLVVVVAFLLIIALAGCGGNRQRTFTKTSFHIGGDGKTNRVESVSFESSIDLKNQQFELENLKLSESFGGADGWQYGANVDGVSSRTDSEIIRLISRAVIEGYYGRQPGDNFDERIRFLEEGFNGINERLDVLLEPNPEE